NALSVNQRYYRAVDTLLKERRTKSDQLGAKKQWQNSASWHEYTAGKLDQLPSVNVDPDLLNYASACAAKIRVMSESLRGVNIQDKVLDTYIRSGWNYGSAWGAYYGGGAYGGWGGYGSNYKDVQSAKAEAAAASA